VSSKVRIQCWIPNDLHAWINKRSHLSMRGNSTDKQAAEDLGLLQMIIDAELEGVRLTLEQARCVADVLNGAILEPAVGGSFGLAFAGCCDAFMGARMGPVPGKSSYGAKHSPGPDMWEEWEDFLLGYLRSLRPAADYALRYAIALWWAREAPDSAEGFAAAGLRIITIDEHDGPRSLGPDVSDWNSPEDSAYDK
jgi:hypothetical protein